MQGSFALSRRRNQTLKCRQLSEIEKVVLVAFVLQSLVYPVSASSPGSASSPACPKPGQTPTTAHEWNTALEKDFSFAPHLVEEIDHRVGKMYVSNSTHVISRAYGLRENNFCTRYFFRFVRKTILKCACLEFSMSVELWHIPHLTNLTRSSQKHRTRLNIISPRGPFGKV